MRTFDIYEDLKLTSWRRVYYKVEANSAEEAAEKVKSGTEDCIDSKLLEFEEFMDPDFSQNGYSTWEIYEEGNDLNPLYKNGI